jgi:hypothetical protein
MKRIFLALSAAASLTLAGCPGCAIVRQTATTTTTTPEGVQTVTVARSTILAAGDARQTVDRVRASAGKTSSVGASGVDQETTSTNAVDLVERVVRAAVQGATRP